MDCQAQLHLAAYHAEPGYRGDTVGPGILCPLDADFSLAVGAYSNSIGRSSGYGAVVWQPWTVSGVRLGGFAGLVSGYKKTAIPMAAAVATLPAFLTSNTHLHFTLIPPVEGYTPSTVELSVSFSF